MDRSKIDCWPRCGWSVNGVSIMTLNQEFFFNLCCIQRLQVTTVLFNYNWFLQDVLYSIHTIVRRTFCKVRGQIEQLVDSLLNCDWFTCSDWKLVDCRPSCQWSVIQGANGLSIEYQLIIDSVDQGLMEGIDGHSTSYACSTCDPKHLCCLIKIRYPTTIMVISFV